MCECVMCDAPLFQDWLISAPPDKPLLNVWQSSRAEQAPVRLFTPAPAQALSASPSGLYLAAATAETITIYLLSTGAVAGVVTRHYQPITVLAWTADSSHLISGGEDGQVRVTLFTFNYVILQNSNISRI